MRIAMGLHCHCHTGIAMRIAMRSVGLRSAMPGCLSSTCLQWELLEMAQRPRKARRATRPPRGGLRRLPRTLTRIEPPVVGRGRVSLWTNLGTWHSEPLRRYGHMVSTNIPPTHFQRVARHTRRGRAQLLAVAVAPAARRRPRPGPTLLKFQSPLLIFISQ
jgi:hypothetical protein